MTTPDAAPPAAHGLPVGRLVLGVMAGFVLALAFGSGALLAYQGQYADRILPGVTVDGVDVAGLSRDAAAARLESALAGYGAGSVAVRVDGATVEVPYAALGRRADVAALVDLAWSVGRGGGDPVDRAARSVRSLLDGTRIGPLVVVDPAAVDREVARLMERFGRAPTNGSASVTPDGFATSSAAAGRGLSAAEVAAALRERLADPAAPPTLHLAFDLVPVEPAVTDAEVAAAVAAATRMANDVVATWGTARWTIPATTVRAWIRFGSTTDGSYAASVDRGAPTKALAALAKEIDKAPKDAGFLVGRGSAVVGVVAAKDGQALNVDASRILVSAAVEARAAIPAGEPLPSVGLAVTTLEPELTTAEAEKTAPLMQRLSSWTTKYEVSERNGYGANITIPTNDINGYVVAPGATFDFWSALGPVTYARGYRDGGAILNGRTEPTGALAGGICSGSTTLFNAAARAGLEILERDNHYYYISRYPIGLDATVWKSGSAQQSMRFRNDTDRPILIRGYASPGRVTFQIWGAPTGRTVTFSTPIVRNVQRATDSTQYTTSLKPGERKRIEYPVDGMQVWITRTVRDAQGTVIHSDTWYSDYRRVNGILLIGKAAEPTPPPSPTPVPTPPAATPAP